jgi:hypothetical protein
MQRAGFISEGRGGADDWRNLRVASAVWLFLGVKLGFVNGLNKRGETGFVPESV